MRRLLRTLLREPLVHFLLIGAALFGIFRITGGASIEPQGRIVIGAGEVERLAMTFSRVYMRPPTSDELRDLIEKEIREEVYAREAVAMGLDRDDEIIRRRLQQKLEFLSEDIGAQREPTEAELREYFGRHPDRFRTDATLSFRQVYVGGERSGAAAESAAKGLLQRLRASGPGVRIEELGDRISLPSEYASARAADVSRDFGPAFAAKLQSLPLGQWEGPVASGYGLHLVLLRERVPGSLPTFDEARPAVEREWQTEQRRLWNESFYKAFRAKYAVTVDLPDWARGAPPRTGSGQAN